MVSTKDLKDENKHWHQEHLLWMKETKQWQHETEKLVALLYLLERALPEQSSALTQHVTLIDGHERQVTNYECGMDEHCLPACPTYKTAEQQASFHQNLAELHERVKQHHLVLKQSYSAEMEKFRTLAKQLLDECEEA